MPLLPLDKKLMRKVQKKISDWPAKLESIWTGNDYAEEKKKKPQPTADDGAKKKSKKKTEEESDEEGDDKKKKKAGKKTAAAAAASSAGSVDSGDPWDFENAIIRLKAARKQIGGSVFDIKTWAEEDKAKLAVEAN